MSNQAATTDFLLLAQYYRTALIKIRDETVPFTKPWRLANDALQKPPKPKIVILAVGPNDKQLEMKFK